MTCSAWLIRKAASSAEPRFHGRSFAAPPPAAAAVAAEAARDHADEAAVHRPAHDVAEDRARRLPTSAPVMIIAVLCSVKPIAAAAQPE